MSRKTWFTLRNTAADSITIDILDEIGLWGVTAKDFAAQIKAAGKPRSITLNLDSPGGDCNDGFTIYDALKNSGAEITVNITGLAASMASVIMLAGSKIRIAENGRVMIHRVTGGAMGNADEMDAAAKVIKQFEDRIVALYVERTGKDEGEIRDLMKAQLGTWFFGQEAIDAGFADEIIKDTKARAFRGEWAAKFTYLPAALFDTSAPASPSRTTSSMKALIKLAALLGINGLADDATEDQLITAITAHKPQSPNVVIDFEDTAVKAAFDKRIAEVVAADKAKITAIETELTNIKALITNGAASAAGGGAPAPAPKAKEEGLSIHEQYVAITNVKDRADFYAKHKNELIK